MAQLLPTRRVGPLAALAALALAGVGVAWASTYAPADDASGTRAMTAGQQALTQAQQTDTDGDGLADWEEQLWGTDPSVADTDGDGTPDGEEVAASRDPSVAGPDDALAQDTRAPRVATSSESISQTESFARSLFGEYIQTRSGGSLSDTQQEQLAQQFAQQAATAASTSRPYAAADLMVVAEPTASDRQDYYGNFQSAIVPLFELEMHELQLAYDALDGNTTAQERLTRHVQTYRRVAEALAAMSVPADVRTRHLAVANSVRQFADILTGIAEAAEDPVRGVGSLGAFTEAESQMESAFAAIGDYAQTHGLGSQ